jgi:hypothetical protein
MEIADFSGMIWVTLFEEAATKFLGKSASEMKQLHETDVSYFVERNNPYCF